MQSKRTSQTLQPQAAWINVISQAKQIVTDIASNLPRPLKHFKGRGVVIPAGGYSYFTNAWVLIRMLRYLGCNLPIQLWYFGSAELNDKMKRLVHRFDVQCLDATPIDIHGSIRGHVLKVAAAMRSSFEEFILIDADNLPVQDPSFLFKTQRYKADGALFWPNYRNASSEGPLWDVFGVPYVEGPEIESGQMVINKDLCWAPFVLVEQLNSYPYVFSPLANDGKDLFRFAWLKCDRAYSIPDFPPQMLTLDLNGVAMDAVLCQQDFSGERLFQHRMFHKWDLLGENPWVSGSFFEGKCHEYLDELRSRWDGRPNGKCHSPKSASASNGEESLIKHTWLLGNSEFVVPNFSAESDGGKGPETAEENLPDFVKSPHNLGYIKLKTPDGRKDRRMNIGTAPLRRALLELQFAQNYTVIRGANSRIAYFWDFDDQSHELVLSTETGDKIRLKRLSETYWEGYWVDGSLSGKRVQLRTVHEVYRHLKNAPQFRISRSNHYKIVRSFGKRVHVTCTAFSIGDQISAAYACAGLARLGVHVTLHTMHADWLSRVAEPNLTITNKPVQKCREINFDYENQLRYGTSRAAWYAAELHPLLKPAKPLVDLCPASRRFPFEYIILAPYGDWRDREWPEGHWGRLANLLRKESYELVAIGKEDQAAGLLRIFGRTQVYWVVGHSPEWVMDALLGAKAYIGVDSDMTQLAALLNIRSFVLHSQLPDSFLWPYAKLESITPNTACSFCRFQEDRGYFQSCDTSCAALATIRPEAVASKLIKCLKEG